MVVDAANEVRGTGPSVGCAADTAVVHPPPPSNAKEAYTSSNNEQIEAAQRFGGDATVGVEGNCIVDAGNATATFSIVEAEAIALQIICWLIGAIFRKFNPLKVPEVPYLMRKYRHAEVELLRTILYKYVAKELGTEADSGRVAPAPHDEQATTYRQLLRELQCEFGGGRNFDEPCWPSGACSEWLRNAFLARVWGLLV